MVAQPLPSNTGASVVDVQAVREAHGRRRRRWSRVRSGLGALLSRTTRLESRRSGQDDHDIHALALLALEGFRHDFGSGTWSEQATADEGMSDGDSARGSLQASPEAFVLLSPDGRILQANRSLDAVIGLDHTQLLGHPVQELRAQLLRVFGEGQLFSALSDTALTEQDCGILLDLAAGYHPRLGEVGLFSVPLRRDESYLGRLVVFFPPVLRNVKRQVRRPGRQEPASRTSILATVELVAFPLESFRHVREYQQALSQLAGIRSIQPRDLHAGVLRLRLQCSEPPALIQQVEAIPGFPSTVRSLEPHRIEIVLVADSMLEHLQDHRQGA